MAMGKRPVARQASPLWVETADLPTSDGHPFFERLNRVLEDCGFDAFVEGLCWAHSRFPGHALTPTGVMAIRCKQFHLPDL